MSRYATDRAQTSLYSGGNTNSPHRFRNTPNRVPTTRESPHFHPSARHNTDDPFDVPLGGGEAPVSPGVVAAGDTLRDIYREKLQQSVDSVVQALTTEVPEDHLLLQLLADPHTESYVKVRLTEIVESFLYASQSDAYHLLALQLAEREKELVDLSYVLENCSRNMDELTATKVGVPKSCQTDLVEYKDGLVADPPIATVVPHHTSANPMEEEAARQELLAILEETAREREIERSREALHPTRQVIDMVRQLEQPTTVPISTAEVSKPVLSLFKALNELVHYVDESLESLDALRNDLDLPGNTSGLSTISAIQSVGNTPMKNHNTSNPQNSRVSHSSNRAVVQQERRACRELLSQLQESHIAMVRYLDRLALTQQQQTAELEEKSRDMEELLEEAAVHKAAVEGTERLQHTLEELRRNYTESTNAEKNDLHEQIEHWRDRFLEAEKQALQLENDKRGLTEENRRLEGLLVHEQKENARLRKEAEEAAVTRDAQESQLEQLQGRVDQAVGDVFALQVELTMSSLQSIYNEAEARKLKLFQRVGLEPAIGKQARETQGALEELRHLGAQLGQQEMSLLEKEAQIKRMLEVLQPLLRLMWNEERVEQSLWPNPETDKGANNNRQTPPSDPLLLSKALQDAYTHLRDLQDARRQEMETLKVANEELEHKLNYARANEANLKKRLEVEKREKENKWKEELEEIRALEEKVQQRERTSTVEVGTQTPFGILSTNRESAAVKTEKEGVHQSTQTTTPPAVADQTRQPPTIESNEKEINALEEIIQLLKAQLANVRNEKDALRQQYIKLNKDYIELERHNGTLHERCFLKEQERSTLESKLRVYEPSLMLSDHDNTNHREDDDG